MQEGVISQAGVSDQIRPFDNLDDAPELSLQLVDAAPAIRSRPPCARMNIEAAHNIGDHIAVENAILRDADPPLLEILDLAVLKTGDVFADLIER